MSTVETIQWVFDRPPASGSVSGGDPAQWAFAPAVEAFVRETLQNSHDQRVDNKPVRVTYELHKLSGAAKEAFTTAMGWNLLEPHVKAAANAPVVSTGRFQGALDMLQKDDLLLLKVVDSGTRGLVGGEDDHGANFNALCRDSLVTTRDKAEKGGSYGLGKAVLALSSRLNTVLFSSTIETNVGFRFRLFGKSDLPYHETGDEEVWLGPGFFGSNEPTKSGERAVSVWDDEAKKLAAPLLLARGQKLGTGTSILIVGFYERGKDTRDPKVIAKDLLAASTKFFWPAIARKSLEVSASVRVNDEVVFSETAELNDDDKEFFSAAFGDVTGEKVGAPREIAERIISLKIPDRRKTAVSDAAPAQTGSVKLRIIGAPDGSQSSELNKIALVRGAGMVVQYWQPPSLPIGGRDFFGVLLAGKYHEGADNAEAVESFLRAAEPPAHDKWTHETEIDSYYMKGTKGILQELRTSMTAMVKEICGADVPDGKEGPDLLRRLFPLGGQLGGPKPPSVQKVQGKIESCELLPDGWHVIGTVNAKKEGETWWAKLKFSLDGESSSETLPITELEILEPEGVTVPIKNDGTVTIQGGPGAGGIRFRAVAARDGDHSTLRRTRLVVEVDPLTSREASNA